MIDFSTLRTWFDSRDAESQQGANRVHEQLDKIHNYFSILKAKTDHYSAYGDSTVARCLPVLLMALGWNGERRHIIEALPHAESITDFTELQMVLNRLNYSMEQIIDPKAERLSECLPCLIEMPDDVAVLLDITQDNRIFVYLGSQDIYVELDISALNGNIFMIKKLKRDTNAKTSKYNWSHATVSVLKNTIYKIVTISFFVNILTLVLSLYVMVVYDKAIGGKSDLSLMFLFIGIVFVLITEIKLRAIRSRMVAYLGSRFDALIQVNTYQSIINLPLIMTENAPLSTQLSRFRQFEVGRELFVSPLASAILDLPFTLFFIGTIFVLGGQLGWITVALTVVFAIMIYTVLPIMEYSTQKTGEAKSKSDTLLVETASKLQSIRENNIEKIWISRIKDRLTSYLDLRFRSQNTSSFLQNIAQSLVLMAALATMALGAMKVMDNIITVGALVGVTTLMWRIFTPMQILFLSISRLKQMLNTISQINHLFRLKLEREPGHVPTFFRNFQGGIMMSNVSFKYAQSNELAIKSINLTVKPNEMLAIIGPNGAGKTTLVRLLMGLYPPLTGAVRLDGLDLRQLDVGEVRQTIAYVAQNIDFYYGTILQNVSLAEPTASKERIIQALEEAKFEANDERFTEGYETRLNFALRAALPEGMMQRLNLARAWVKDAPIYILDEPGTKLDIEGDQALMKKLQSLKGKSTVIYSTARPSHMMMADRVICIVKGQIVAEGKPEDVVPKYMEAMNRAAA